MEEEEVVTRLESSTLLIHFCWKNLDMHSLLSTPNVEEIFLMINDEVYRLEKSLDATTTFFATSATPENSSVFYRLEKSLDATTTFFATSARPENSSILSPLPPNHKFSRTDVIVMSLQPRGMGDSSEHHPFPRSKMP